MSEKRAETSLFDASRLPQNVTGWIGLTDEVQFEHGSVWLMAVPVESLTDSCGWRYDLDVVTVDCDGPLRLECNGVPWAWEFADVAYMALLQK